MLHATYGSGVDPATRVPPMARGGGACRAIAHGSLVATRRVAPGRQRSTTRQRAPATYSDSYARRVATVCERCISDLLYCDVHDADFCPVCDEWVSSGCGDPECVYCPGRAARPSQCSHDQAVRHYNIHS